MDFEEKNTSNNTADWTVEIKDVDLEIAKKGPSEAVAGQEVTYTYEVKNLGNFGVAAVVVDDNGTQGNTSDDVTLTLESGDTNSNGKVDPGETWKYTYKYTPTKAGEYTNTAIVSCKDASIVDSNPENNKDSWTVCVQAQAECIIFCDVDDHWACKYIYDLAGKGMLDGYPDCTFRPENKISREEAAQILSKYVGGKETSAEVPSDSLGRWSTPAIQNLMSKGIIDGYEDGCFRPENKITRAEFATMVYRVLYEKGKIDSKLNNSFSDVSGHWAENYIEILAGNGIMEGYEDGCFRPQGKITRAEAAAIVSRASSK